MLACKPTLDTTTGADQMQDTQVEETPMELLMMIPMKKKMMDLKSKYIPPYSKDSPENDPMLIC